jgi:hypothetical protein
MRRLALSLAHRCDYVDREILLSRLVRRIRQTLNVSFVLCALCGQSHCQGCRMCERWSSLLMKVMEQVLQEYPRGIEAMLNLSFCEVESLEWVGKLRTYPLRRK